MFMHAWDPKQIRRTTLFLSCYMTLCNISTPCWNLLQRLKILCSKEKVEEWINKQTKKVKSADLVLFFIMDNCNFYLHVTKRTSMHASR